MSTATSNTVLSMLMDSNSTTQTTQTTQTTSTAPARKDNVTTPVMKPIAAQASRSRWDDLPNLEYDEAGSNHVTDMSLFVSNVAMIFSDDEHVIPIEIEVQVAKKVEMAVKAMRIGEIRRIDLKINTDKNTGGKHIDAFIHLYWFDNLPASQVQAEINVYGKYTWHVRDNERPADKPFWVFKKNNNPMSLEEVRLMKDLGCRIRLMIATHEEVKRKVYWPEIDKYIADMDEIVRYELNHAHRLQSPYGPRYCFMWLKYMRCGELIESMRIRLRGGPVRRN